MERGKKEGIFTKFFESDLGKLLATAVLALGALLLGREIVAASA